MKKYFASTLAIFFTLFVLTSCHRNSSDVWEDTKTAGRHVGRGFRSLGGKHGDSRQVQCKDDFIYIEEDNVSRRGLDYIPLEDTERCEEVAMNDSFIIQPRENPGDPNSSIPGIEAFKDPSIIPGAESVFEVIHFDYNSNFIKGDRQLVALRKIAEYLKTHPGTYVFIAGHCDERGAEAYNLALGSRRAHSVRNFLLKEGVHPDTLFTISYGKERPLILGHNEAAWAENRRAEFKVYQK